jgi:O-antigen ligase
MLINLFGIYFHPLEIPLLVFLIGAVALEFIYNGAMIEVNKASRAFWLFVFLTFYICAIVLSALNAIEVSLVFKSAVKWAEVALISILIFLYISNEKRFQLIYWILFVSTFVLVLWVFMNVLRGRVSFFTYRLFPGTESAFSIALLLPFVKQKQKWFYLLFFISLVSCLLSLSRMAWLALVVMLFFYCYSQKSLRSIFKFMFIAFIILAVIYYLKPGLLLYRSLELFSAKSASNVERTALINVAFTAMSNHPFIGIGSLNFSRFMLKENLTEGIIAPNLDTLGPHNAFLQVAAEEGLIGLSFFCLTLFLTWRLFRKAFKQGSAEKPYLLGLCGFFIVMFFNLAFGFISAQFRFFLAIMIGLASATERLPILKQESNGE